MLYQCLLSKEESGRPTASSHEKAEAVTNKMCDIALYTLYLFHFTFWSEVVCLVLAASLRQGTADCLMNYRVDTVYTNVTDRQTDTSSQRCAVCVE